MLVTELFEKFNWDKNDARKIWAFGPDDSGPNVLVEQTSGVQFMEEVKDSCKAAFQWATKEGVMCQEAMRGVKVNIVDFMMIADSAHRGGG